MRLLNSLFHVERIRFICPKAPVIRLYRLVIRPESGLPELSFLCLLGNLLDQMLFFFVQIFIVQHDTPPFSDCRFFGGCSMFPKRMPFVSSFLG